MTVFKRSMHWLGLGPDEDYDYDESYDEDYDTDAELAGAPVEEEVRVVAASPVRPVPRPLEEPPRRAGAVGGHRAPRAAVAGSQPARPVVVVPASFDQAQEVADTFKESVPVIVNLQGAERDLSRRLIDFSSGLCYGLGGHMEKVANQVYLLTPSDVTVSPEDRRQLRERGLTDR